MPQIEPNVKLIRYTPAPEEIVAMAGRLCYSPADLDALEDRVSRQDQGKYLQKVSSMGHHSLLEHAVFTFGLEGVSRSLLAQITRHRIASFSVQSQRYVGMEEDFGYVVPPSIRELGPEAVESYCAQMEQIGQWYAQWMEKVPKEDARFLLPNAASTRMLVTMNARELLHFFSLRCCNRAQWEIREVAWRMLYLAREAAPDLFHRAGPACLFGPCPEGKMTCGHPETARQRAGLAEK